MGSTIAERLGRLRFANPFEAFELVLRDGRRVTIAEPEHVGWHEEHNVVSYAADDDSFEHRMLSDVADAQPLRRDHREPAA